MPAPSKICRGLPAKLTRHEVGGVSRTPAVGTCTYWFTDRFQHKKNQGTGDGRGSLNDLHMVVEGGTELVLCDASQLGRGGGTGT